MNFVYIATSLDGFIATPDGGVDWLNNIPNPEKSDFGFAAFMDRIDALVMGRTTFETVVGFGEWPYTKPVFILSHQLPAIPDHLAGKAILIKGDISTVLEQLSQKGFKNLYIDGGKVIQQFLQHDLIDELIITKIPILLGDGISLFGKINQQLQFEHSETEILNNSLVKSRYVRKRDA